MLYAVVIVSFLVFSCAYYLEVGRSHNATHHDSLLALLLSVPRLILLLLVFVLVNYLLLLLSSHFAFVNTVSRNQPTRKALGHQYLNRLSN